MRFFGITGTTSEVLSSSKFHIRTVDEKLKTLLTKHHKLPCAKLAKAGDSKPNYLKQFKFFVGLQTLRFVIDFTKSIQLQLTT